eukprot:TRINITY_DN16516_c0_g1_i1.p1 TRINITY_DN16516_c0_g1~~TRINITY_DN16516_c0_g1_i1.p1  ORF type:complete len:388 (-),score=44.55 TRINITY_DN16516_c0_g1_i1:142-1305(-)
MAAIGDVIDLTDESPATGVGASGNDFDLLAGASGVSSGSKRRSQYHRCAKQCRRNSRYNCELKIGEGGTSSEVQILSCSENIQNVRSKRRSSEIDVVGGVEIVSVTGIVPTNSQQSGWTCKFCTLKNGNTQNWCTACAHAKNEVFITTSQQTGTCPSCFEEIRLVDQFQVKRCGHVMCQECAKNYVTTEIRSNNIPIPCMVCKVEQCQLCSMAGPSDEDIKQCCKLSQQDVKEVLEEQEFERYLKLEGKECVRNLEFFTCPGTDCGGAYEVEDGMIYFKCPECEFEFCVQCGVEWHKGSTCKKYQQWRKENEVADDRFKGMHKSACPKCKHAVIKESDKQCNKMYCTCCKIYFCYLCEQKIRGYDHFARKDSQCYQKLWHGVNVQRR